ncbi:tRNA delta(2)-isopentenylpyrophosphate transferase [Ruminiclostridium papyrosolvens DSM 2782]|uniref:tRNA dimethylallyltransferase n=1 Tax=Ruminiclostridium papyrosolvens DSM 2782 TaxID=588581 RepID=F1TA45_9FIRM|nr:tRNA (adenosine(37)-N6)-dimethylallyltransferase MiaA [Ruminiclostridium papyrosolvens]EGD48787.1 tRNA delta(2)-isopentenylpyrophosphate transferase [Ruminiclostridium papyrosolvens DSM 2782]WES32459.1 tRNA (adenosine(37)-N6)-dimethylallyltransferase MiaA [Ruminiclostridium papyrosolvens DSM 2782]
MNRVIVIVGPTASGKTNLSIELAKRMNGEIISADSMQIYKYMDIGTAKPTKEEMQDISHYLIDEVLPNEDFNVVRFKELAEKYIDNILENGKQPIVAGGTGLYISSLINNINFSESESDWELREALKKEAEEFGPEYLHKKLQEVDPNSALSIHPNNIKRVIRALEVYYQTQKPISYHNEISRSIPPKYQFVLVGLNMDRQVLYERINKRVDIMIQNGLVDEVKRLVDLGYADSIISMQGIGYKEILEFLRNNITLEQAIDNIKQGTRRYAKRQITWFKRIHGINWFNVDNCGNNINVINEIYEYAKG